MKERGTQQGSSLRTPASAATACRTLDRSIASFVAIMFTCGNSHYIDRSSTTGKASRRATGISHQETQAIQDAVAQLHGVKGATLFCHRFASLHGPDSSDD